MRRFIYLLAMLWLAFTIAGCTSMSKKDCENADWHTIGYNDGARGIYFSNLDSYRQRCSEYQITPDANAYQTGWNQGIRMYCTSDNGYRAGVSGQAYKNICPADVAPGYRVGWQQGVQQYCSPDNGLRQGLAGHYYRGVCPQEMEGAFQNRYRLGMDVRRARANHQNLEYKLERVRNNLGAEKDTHRRHDLLEKLAHLRQEEEHSEFMVSALEACTNDDWFDVGLSDGESGNPYQARKIASVCRNYGSGEDVAGYRDGWSRGNSHYCSYDMGLYAGQNNQEYQGVCRGPKYPLFWGGYLQGIHLFQAGRYENHPRPQYPREERHSREERFRPMVQNGHEKAHIAERPSARGSQLEQLEQSMLGKSVSNKPADRQKMMQPRQEPVTQPDRHARTENRKPANKAGNKAGNKKPADKQKKAHPGRKNKTGKDQGKNNKPADKQQTDKQQTDEQQADHPDNKHGAQPMLE